MWDYEKYNKFNRKLMRTTILGKKPLYFGFYQEICNFYIFLYYFMLKSTKFHSEKNIFSWYFGYLCMCNECQTFYIQLKLCPFPSKDSFIQIAVEWSILVVRTSYLYENNAKMLKYVFLVLWIFVYA